MPSNPCRGLPLASLLVFLCVALRLLAQTPTQAAKFEVASINRSDPGSVFARRVSLVTGPASVTARNVSVADCIRTAYEGQFQFASGSPEWVRNTRFMIDAKAAGPVSREQLMEMFRSLLADRFHLAAHIETRESPVYALMVGKDLKLRDSPPEAERGVHLEKDIRVVEHMSMPRFVQMLNSIVTFLDMPVVDATGLDGYYDFPFNYTMDLRNRTADPILGALQDVGLKLVPRKSPVKFLIVDRVELPTEN